MIFFLLLPFLHESLTWLRIPGKVNDRPRHRMGCRWQQRESSSRPEKEAAAGGKRGRGIRCNSQSVRKNQAVGLTLPLNVYLLSCKSCSSFVLTSDFIILFSLLNKSVPIDSEGVRRIRRREETIFTSSPGFVCISFVSDDRFCRSACCCRIARPVPSAPLSHSSGSRSVN